MNGIIHTTRKRDTIRGCLAIVLCLFLKAVPPCLGQNTTSPQEPARATSFEPHGRYEEGIAHFKAGRLAEGLACFQDVSSRASGYAQLCATHMVGLIHRIEDRASEAAAAFERVIAQSRVLQPTLDATSPVARHVDVLERLARISLAEICEQQRDWAAAVRHYEIFLKQYDRDSDNPANVLAPNPALYEKLGRILWRLERYDEARAAFSSLLEHWPNAPRAPLIGVALLALEAAPQTVRNQRLAFLSSSLTWPLESQVVDAETAAIPLPDLEQLGDPADPIRLRLKALKAQCPEDSRESLILAMYLGWMFFETGRIDEAEKFFVRIARTAPSTEDEFIKRLQSYAELSRALVYAQEGKFEEALAITDELMKGQLRGHLRHLASNLAQSFQQRHSNATVRHGE